MSKPKIADVKDIREEIGDKRYVIVGDIHGCFKELMGLLQSVEFVYGRDVLISVGDIGDRGPDVKSTFDFICSTSNVYSVRGNHDDKLYRYILGNPVHVADGLDETINQLDNLAKYKSFFRDLPYILRVEAGYVVHAGFNPNRHIEHQLTHDCLYMRYYGGKDYFDRSATYWSDMWTGPQVFHGHQPVFDETTLEDLENIGRRRYAVAPSSTNVVNLDGGCVFGGSLRLWDSADGCVHSFKAYQSYSL